MRLSVYIFLGLILLAQACASNDAEPACVEKTVAEQDAEIAAYATANNLNTTTTTSGLRYVINTPGSGDNAMVGDTVEVAFEGFFLDGTSFTQGVFDPFEIGTVGLISGFEESLLLLSEGAQGTFILPSILGYGCFPPQGSGIPENQILIFEITMVSINP